MTDIHVLTITHGAAGTQDRFFYKSAESGKKAFHAFVNDVPPGISFADDFGTLGSIGGDIASVTLTSTEASLEVQTEQSLLQAKAQAKAQRRASSDPVLNLGIMRQ